MATHTITTERVIHIFVAGHQPTRDPRISWQMASGSKTDCFLAIGLDHRPADATASTTRIADNAIEIVGSRNQASRLAATTEAELSRRCLDVLSLLRELDRVALMTPSEIAQQFDVDLREAMRLIDTCRHFQRATVCLTRIARRLPKPDVVVAADLDSLFAGVFAKYLFGARLIYDAHEFFAEASDYPPLISQFWQNVEQALVRHIDAGFVASDPTAEYMQDLYKVPLRGLNNAEPLSGRARDYDLSERDNSKPVSFLFIGGISRQRGLHLLAAAWKHVSANAILNIQGPIGDLEYWEAVKQAAGPLLGTRIHHIPPVTEAELINACRQADVGLIPYEPITINNKFCCPNKLSQYLMAGVPIIANDLPFVRSVIESGECGLALDFTDAKALAAAIDKVALDPKWRQQAAANARRHAERSFNWTEQSREFYSEIAKSRHELREIIVSNGITLEPVRPYDLFRFDVERYGLIEIPQIYFDKRPSMHWNNIYWRVDKVFPKDNYIREFIIPYEAQIAGIYIEFEPNSEINYVKIMTSAPYKRSFVKETEVNSFQAYIQVPHLAVREIEVSGHGDYAIKNLIILTSFK